MNLSCLLSLLKESPTYRQLVRQLSRANGECKAVMLDSAKSYFIATLHEELGLPLMIITAQPESARRLFEQLQVWCPPSASLHRFPEPDLLPYKYLAPHSSNATLERLQTLAALALYQKGGQPPLIVASALATISKTIPQRDFLSTCHALEQGTLVNPLELLSRWQSMGYEMVDVVETHGSMSKRGGIIDVFPPCSKSPARIEFFGNKIESMRLFDTESQRSTTPICSITITPTGELALPKPDQAIGALNLNNCTIEMKQHFQEDMAKLQQGQWPQCAEFYSPLFNDGTILDYLHDNTLVILDAPEEAKIAIERINIESQELRNASIEQGELPRDFPSPYLSWEELVPKLRERQLLALESWNVNENHGQILPFVSPHSYGGKLERFLKEAKQMIHQGQRLLIVSHQASRLAELLQEADIHVSPSPQIEQSPPPGSITLFQGSLPQGWEIKNVLVLITDAELFGFVKQARHSKKMPVRRQWLLPQLKPGDYVVHVDHGIGRFHGLTKMSSYGVEREYLVLEYAGSDKLYVPTEQIERISHYIGAGDQPPSLNRLGTQEWEGTKKRIKQSVADIAQELLDLYAARELTPGFAFSSDTLWQQEFEASFPYMETPDQLEVITAVKEDMEKPKPMDRLICGDVGYGKTEVALRAAFKAVLDNKQVAILVPTTVLAQQHFATSGERLQAFPLKVEMLSRFCSPEKERGVLDGLANGTVDICIGTHRLLQKDITFKNLGLVIIDEEQQFGVVQKEKLKQVRKEIDVLTLSATPIPRTFYMSLTGARDMSIMETPPEERLSIKTHVGAYDETLVRQAILRELERNGQVFFVHNRVQSIALAARKLQVLIPEARIAIAHGQMPEEKLEKIMADFIAGKSDILVTTTIIQSGLDMPNVNTLIVDQADRFGLTQLYQLRGRVGRGINQAHTYFLFDKDKQLTHQAYKRLRTISEATGLGAGFGIAMRDLEIRGAGNLLGVKQSGHIAALGFDLYCQLLAEAVEDLKAKRSGHERPSIIATKAKQSPSISLPLSAYLPEDYVPSLNARLSLYHKLASIKRTEEIEDTVRELEDRFGALPEPVRNLFYSLEVKALAIESETQSITTEGKQIVIRLSSEKELSRLRTDRRYDGIVRAGRTQVRLDMRKVRDRWPEVLKEILNLL